MYDEQKALQAVRFINSLKHGIGEFHGQPFELFPWQDKIVRDIFGTVKPNGYRQYKKAYIEIPKKNGKSEFGAAIALKMLCADGEQCAQVYSCAADRQQASIVFDVAVSMVDQAPALKKHIKPVLSQKRLVYKPTRSFYQVLSAEVNTKHGLNVSCCIFDELHAQPNRDLWDVMTSGSGDARRQPLFLTLTTAGQSRHGICYEQHKIARGILDGTRVDPTFYPVIYGLEDDEDWTDEANWYRANPSLGRTIDIETVREWYQSCLGSAVAEANFKWLRLNMWLDASTHWLDMTNWDACTETVDPEELRGRDCYGGLDLSKTQDLTAFVLCFPPRNEDEKYIFLLWCWIPEECMHERVNRDKVPYDQWHREGHITVTEGNIVDYRKIRADIEKIAEFYNIREIAYDRYNATETILELMDDGLTMVPFGQGYRDMSPPTKDIETKIIAHKIIHNGNPVLRWNFSNVVVKTDEAGNIKPDKNKSVEKIDGAVAAIMAYGRASVSRDDSESVYDTRGMIVI